MEKTLKQRIKRWGHIAAFQGGKPSDRTLELLELLELSNV